MRRRPAGGQPVAAPENLATAPKLSLKILAERWGWSTQKLYRLANHADPAQRIPHVRIGREIFFEEAVLARWLDDRRFLPPTSATPTTPTRAEECAALGIAEDHEFS